MESDAVTKSCEKALEDITLYLKGEVNATNQEYQLLRRMNDAASAKYKKAVKWELGEAGDECEMAHAF
jgi:hypothetical protein